MNHKSKKFLFFFIVIGAVLTLFNFRALFTAEEDLLMERGYYRPYQQLKVLEDSDGNLDIEEIISGDMDDEFSFYEGNTPSYSFTESAYWFKFEPVKYEGDLLLELGYPIIQQIDFYYPLENGEYVKIETGAKYPFRQRPILHRNFLFPLSTDEGEAGAYYLRTKTENAHILPLKIWDKDSFISGTVSEYIIQGIYYGMLLIIILHHLFLYVFVKRRKCLYYILYILSIGFFHFTLSGLAFQYLWPRFPWWGSRALFIFIFSASIFLMLFAGDILSVKKNIPAAHMAMRTLVGFAAFMIPCSLFLPYTFVMLTAIFTLFIGSLIFLLTVVFSWSKSHRTSKYLITAWFFLLGGIFLLNGRSLGIFPHSFLTMFGIQIGSTLEIVFLSLALADNTYILEREREEANYLARTDELTGIYNRRAFFEAGEKFMKKALTEDFSFSVIMLDIDNFKEINDQYGHHVGDHILRIFAQRLTDYLKDADFCGRLGGDEFGIFLVSKGFDSAVKAAEEICRNVEEHPFNLDDYGGIRISISLGIVPFKGETGIEELLKRADCALYSAKEEGGSVYAAF